MTEEQKEALEEWNLEIELFEQFELPLLFSQLEAVGVKPRQALLAFKKWSDEHYLYKGHTPVEIAYKKYNLLGTSEHTTTDDLAKAIKNCIGATQQ